MCTSKFWINFLSTPNIKCQKNFKTIFISQKVNLALIDDMFRSYLTHADKLYEFDIINTRIFIKVQQTSFKQFECKNTTIVGVKEPGKKATKNMTIYTSLCNKYQSNIIAGT